MATTNLTVKQHYVPRFYLKLFADSQKLLQVYNVKDKRLEKPRTYSSLGYERYFYAAETGTPDKLSQTIEAWLGVHENIIAQNLPKIINKIINLEQIVDDDRYILSALMCMLWLRSPKMRDELNRMHEDAMKQIMSFNPSQQVDNYINKTGSKMSESGRKGLVEMLENGSYDMKFNNVQHLQFMTDTLGFESQGFTNMFFGQKWKIYIAKGTKRFITTDSPVVEMWTPPEDFYGSSFLERNKYFALTPEILIELSVPIGSRKVKRETLFKEMDNTVDLLNVILAANCHQYAYTDDKKIFEEMILGRATPRPSDIEYIKRFVIPWRKYKQERGIA
jgi:hypothetical protein